MSAKAKRFLALMFFLTTMLAAACGFTLIYVAQELIYAIVMMFVFAAACFITGCVLYAKNKDVVDPPDEEKPVATPYTVPSSSKSFNDDEDDYDEPEDEFDEEEDEEERRCREEEEDEEDYEEYELYDDDDDLFK